MGESEARLVEAARHGDEDALAQLCRRYEQHNLRRIQRRLSPALRRKVSCADVFQEARIVAHRRIAEFEDRGEGAFGHWLARIVELKTREAVRKYAGTAKRAAVREVTRAQRGATAEVRGRIDSPSQAAAAAELREAAREAIDDLPEQYREVIHLMQREHLSLADAAERMGRSKEAVRGLYARALARLAQALELYGK